jgi:hypothetical protein
VEIAGNFRQLSDLRPIDGDTVLSQFRKDLFRGFMIPKRGAWANVEPNGIPGNPGLTESDQPGSLA